MPYVNCPNCEKRLKAPEGADPMSLRCPVCRHVFNSSANGKEPVGATSAAGTYAAVAASGQADAPDDAARQADAPANDDGRAAAPDEGLDLQLSAADEAMLREYDSGTGLLELTREVYGTSLDSWGSGGPGEGNLHAGGAPPEPRQFQIVATALSLANRLVATFKVEVVRTRKAARLGWILVAVLAVASAGGLWWSTRQAGSIQVQMARADGLTKRAADLDARVSEEKDEKAKLTSQLDLLRREQARLQGELTTAGTSLAESEAKVRIATIEQEAADNRTAAVATDLQEATGEIDRLTTDLKDARANIASLKTELAVAKAAATPPATQPAAPEPTTQTAGP